MGDLSFSISEHALFLAVFADFVTILREPRLHWCKAFLWRNALDEVDGQVTFDNLEATHAREKLKSVALAGTGPAMARQFAILRPVSTETRQAAGVDDARMAAECTFLGTDIKLAVAIGRPPSATWTSRLDRARAVISRRSRRD
jgi:hypothetical protein